MGNKAYSANSEPNIIMTCKLECIPRDTIIAYRKEESLSHDAQHRFLHCHSCITSLVDAINIVTKAANEIDDVDLYILDLSIFSTKSTAPVRILCVKLSSIGVDKKNEKIRLYGVFYATSYPNSSTLQNAFPIDHNIVFISAPL